MSVLEPMPPLWIYWPMLVLFLAMLVIWVKVMSDDLRRLRQERKPDTVKVKILTVAFCVGTLAILGEVTLLILIGLAHA
jgi:hypothetical protein